MSLSFLNHHRTQLTPPGSEHNLLLLLKSFTHRTRRLFVRQYLKYSERIKDVNTTILAARKKYFEYAVDGEPIDRFAADVSHMKVTRPRIMNNLDLDLWI